MAEAMTFTSLKADLRRYLERGYPEDTEVYEQIPKLIDLAQRSLAQALKIQGFVVPYITTLQANVSVYQKPARWRQTVSMQIGTNTALTAAGNNRRFILPRSLEYCRVYWPNSDETETPLFYADYDREHWLIAPTPAVAFNWEVITYQLPPLLGDDTGTNYFTKYAPNALLYRALVEASPFLKNDQRIGTWQGLLDRELQTLDLEDLQNIANRASVRTEN